MTWASADLSVSNRNAVVECESRRDLWFALLTWGSLFAIMSVIVIGSFVITPEALVDGRVAIVPMCPMRSMFGRECLTCGMTRGFAAIGHGRLGDAIGYNRASPVSYVFIWASAALGAVQTIRTLRMLQRAGARRIG
jgi:hypothetical protein